MRFSQRLLLAGTIGSILGGCADSLARRPSVLPTDTRAVAGTWLYQERDLQSPRGALSIGRERVLFTVVDQAVIDSLIVRSTLDPDSGAGRIELLDGSRLYLHPGDTIQFEQQEDGQLVRLRRYLDVHIVTAAGHGSDHGKLLRMWSSDAQHPIELIQSRPPAQAARPIATTSEHPVSASETAPDTTADQHFLASCRPFDELAQELIRARHDGLARAALTRTLDQQLHRLRQRLLARLEQQATQPSSDLMQVGADHQHLQGYRDAAEHWLANI